MADKDEISSIDQEQTLDVEEVQRHLDVLEDRLDNIDSVITAVVERVMKQPLTINMTCPHCGKNIEIALIGSEKPTG